MGKELDQRTQTMLWLGLLGIWALIWTGGGIGFMMGGGDQGQDAAYLARPLTDALAPGVEIRVEGHLAPGQTIRSPVEGTEAAASMTEVWYVSQYTDKNNKYQTSWWEIGTTRRGPEALEILVGDQTLLLPAERWTAGFQIARGTTGVGPELPSGLAIDAAALEDAKANAPGGFQGYGIRESVLAPEAPVFVVGQLDAEGPDLVIGPDPVSGQVELYQGTQAEMVAEVQGSATGLRIAGGVLLVIAWVPALIYLWVRSASR